MKYALGNMLNGAGSLNPDGLSLDLQFAADKTLTARKGPTPVFTRGSTGTFVGSNGLIQSAAINAARFDHNPTTLASLGLLIEESRTNLITDSNAFNNWTTTSATVATSSVSTPEGTANSWKVVEDLLLSIHSVTRSFTPVSGTTYTASVWLKAAENGFAFVGLVGGGFATFTLISVNLSTGAVTTATGTPVGSTSVAYSNGWWRVSISQVATSSASSNIDIRLSRDGVFANRSYLGNGVNGMYVYGAQVEAGAFPTSYIPTVAASVVRSADLCSITGANFTSFYNQSEGTIIGQGIVDTVGAGILFPSFANFNDGTANNRVLLGTTNSGGEAVRPNVVAAGSLVFSNSIGTSSAGQSRKVGVVYKQNDFIAAHNGTLTAADNTGNVPSGIDRVSFDASFFVGTIARIRYFKKRLPNAKIQTLTT